MEYSVQDVVSLHLPGVADDGAGGDHRLGDGARAVGDGQGGGLVSPVS